MLRRSVARRGAGFAEFSLGKIADNVRERKVSHVDAHSVHSVASAQTVALGQAVGRLDLPCNEHLTPMSPDDLELSLQRPSLTLNSCKVSSHRQVYETTK